MKKTIVSRCLTGLFVMITLMNALMPCYFVAEAYADLETTAWRVPAQITIDADLGEWNTSTPLVLDRAEQLVRDANQWTGTDDLSAKMYFMWDQDNLYLAGEVQDDTPFMYREGFPPDMADAMVLFFSTNPAADPARVKYEATDFRLVMIIDDYYFNTGLDRDMVENTCGLETKGDDGDDQILDGYEYAVKEIVGGYIYEAVIPWSNFANEQIPVLSPEAGMAIGFDFAMYDLDFPCPGVATVSMSWTGSTEGDTNPSTWGRLLFQE